MRLSSGLGLARAARLGFAPLLTAVQPNFGSADGGQSITLQGYWSGTPTVTIGGVAATVTSSTSTSATVTVPAGTASATAVNVVVTTRGKASAPVSYWYLPGGLRVHWDAYASAGITFNSSKVSAVADSSPNGYAGSQATAAQQFGYSSSVAALSGRPAFVGSGAQSLNGGTFTSALSLPTTHIVVGAFTSQGANDQIFTDGYAGGTSATRHAIIYALQETPHGWSVFTGNGAQELSGSTTPVSTAFCITGVINTTAGTCALYNGSTSLGTLSGAAPGGTLTGWTLGSRYAQSSGLWYGVNGPLATGLLYPRDLNATEIGIVASIMRQNFGSPS